VLYFFVIGLVDGSVSSFNIALWLALVGIAIAVPLGGWRLDAAGRRKTATALLAVVAVPEIAYALFALLIISTQPRWN
jgi:ABC-type spermidine/putrescine transport system permease subunit II